MGVACGAGAALCWALGFVAARHGIDVGMSPLRPCAAPFRLARTGAVALRCHQRLARSRRHRMEARIHACGVWRAAARASSYLGYLFVPLGHGGIIQPSCAALGGMILARLVLKEPLPARRVVGALVIVLGLAVIGAEAVRTIGAHGVGGDLLFVAAGCFFAVFGMLVRRWRVAAMQAVIVTSMLVARRPADAVFRLRQYGRGRLLGEFVPGRRFRAPSLDRRLLICSLAP